MSARHFFFVQLLAEVAEDFLVADGTFALGGCVRLL